jgi:hypothetical protein
MIAARFLPISRGSIPTEICEAKRIEKPLPKSDGGFAF